MKRVRSAAAAILTAVMLSFLPSAAGYCAIVNFDVETASEEYNNLEGSVIYYENGVNADELYAAASAWVQIPSSVLTALYEYDCRIYLSCSAISDPEERSYVTGETHYPAFICDARDLSIVAAQGQAYVVCITADTDISTTVLHEIGHLFDGVIATRRSGYIRNNSAFTLSSSDEWLALYTQYKDAMSKMDTNASMNMYSTAEAFAEAFRLYNSRPEALQSAAPGVYEYVRAAIEQYAG